MIKHNQAQGPRLVAGLAVDVDPKPIARLQRVFSSSLHLPLESEPQLPGALCHVLQLPGSPVRAELAYETARAYEIGEHRAQQSATAIEYFHGSSLLFDDLSCMDNAEQRPGALKNEGYHR